MDFDFQQAQAMFAGAQGAVAVNVAIFAQIYTALFGPMQGAVNGITGALSGTVAGWVTAAVVCVLMIWAASMALTFETTLFDKMLTKVLIPAAVVLFILQGHYQTFVTDPATQLATSIGNTLVGNVGGNAINGGAPFDTLWNKAYAAGVTVYNAIPSIILDPKGLIIAFCVIIYWAVAAVAIGFAFILFLCSQMGLYLLLAIGPLFIAFGAVQYTRFLLKGYVSAVASVICTQVLVLTLLAIATAVEQTIIQPLINAPANANLTGMADQLLIVGVLLAGCTVLAFKLAAYAVGICGGIFDGIMPWFAAGSVMARPVAAGAMAAGSAAAAAMPVTRPFTAAGRSLSGA
jgi:TrbL/VirB6 plasmid conjugal transfer protein